MTKRILCLLLAFCCIAVCCACGSETESEPVTSEGTPSEEPKEESEASFVENEKVQAIKQMLSGGEIDRTLKAKNLFAGKTYTYNTEPSESYPDPGNKKLTDGIVRDLFDKWNWVAFNKGLNVTVIFDLGTEKHKLAEVEVGVLSQHAYGIYLPTNVRLSVSDDAKTWVDLVTIQPPSDAAASSKCILRFALPKATEAQYVRLMFNPNSSGFLFLDEISGYEYCETGNIDVQNGENAGTSKKEFDFYGYTLSKEILVPVSESDPDFDTYQNLARLPGVNVQATHFDPMDDALCRDNAAKERLAELIDGKFASTAYHGDPAFLRFYRGCGRSIVIDLGNEMAVDKVTGEFLNLVPAGIGVPPAVMVEVSSDGDAWTTAWADFTGVYEDKTSQNYRLEAKFKDLFRCRYVRISFRTVPLNEITSSVYASEFEVYGKKNTKDALIAEYDESIRIGRYPTKEEAGCSNILFGGLAPATANHGTLTVDQAKELIAFLDEDGNIQDTFMDSICFSDTAELNTSDLKTTAEGLMDRIFAENVNLAAANTAMGEVNAALGTSEKEGIWISLICPNAGTKCSDIDGDGKEEDMASVADRVKFVKWEIDTYIKKFTEGNYENCKLLGFYWLDECIDREDGDKDALTIKEVSKYIHSKGYRHFWCPYYSAYGIWRWQEVGFDFACYQPNYMFYSTEATRLRAASTIAKINGLCMEIEIEDNENTGSCAIYRKYLREGYDSGVMHSVKMYYHGSISGAINSARTKKAAHTKAIYTDTYLYSKEKLDDEYNKAAVASLDAFTDLTAEVVNGRRLSLNIVDPEVADATAYHLRVIQSPVHGIFRLNNNGEFTMNAMKGYDGTDNVKIEISDDAGNRKVITLIIDFLQK